ncbi:tyrosine-type recombinase/integrase [Rhodobacteraceae bacterium]|nr:tyrosine-type recombinase/integrase [Paracoccaceae bacterium]
MTRSLINNGTKKPPEAEMSSSTSLRPSGDAQRGDTDFVRDDLTGIDLEELLSDADEKDEDDKEDITLPAHVAGSGSLDRLVDQARDYAASATAENTNKAYKADWKHFASWCRRKGIDPLPPRGDAPSPAVIGLYISDCAKPQDGSPALRVSTIERRMSGLSSMYRQRGLVLNLKDRHIASVWAGIKRQHARPPEQKEPVSPEELLEMVSLLSFGLRDMRDRAILFIGYAGGMRRSEIVGLDVNRGDTDDARGWVDIEKGGAIVVLDTKTGWKEKEIARGSSDQTCPVHALEQWLHYAKIAHGPIFRRVSRDNSGVQTDRLSDKHVARLIKRTMLEAGIRPDLPDSERVNLFSGHSLRSGLASFAEVDERYVQKQLGHASPEQTRAYQRRRDRFRVNLTKAAGL